MTQGVSYTGLSQLVKALHEIQPAIESEFNAELKAIGEVVASDAARRFAGLPAHGSPATAASYRRTASGFKSRVRAGGRVTVEQTRRRKTGRRGDYGGLMMRRALLPARAAHLDEAAERAERAVGRALSRAGF
jgi:hypothetical protein